MLRRCLSLSLSLALLTACSVPTSPAPLPAAAGAIAQFQQIDTRIGSGSEAAVGDQVRVHYTGWLYDKRRAEQHGDVFDSSRKRGEPFAFRLGAGQVIRGWDQGVVGMKVGGRRTLLLPPAFGYGERGAGAVIPPGASLVFDVELLDVQRGP